MRNNIIQIDVSNSRYETDEGLIKIMIRNEDFLQVNISKLFIRSKYLLDKYKYSEALNSLQSEIKEIEEKFKMRGESIKLFLELAQEDKINLPIDHYKDVYTLSEYFCIPKFTKELDNVYEKYLLKDLDFTLQILKDSKTSNNDLETKLTIQIENFLRTRINECIENTKFKELPVSTISRILNKCQGNFNHNLLLDFIFESSSTRHILFKFIELHQLKDDKVDELIQFIEKQEENSKKLYLEYMNFNLSFIQNMRNQYNQLLKELKQSKIIQEQTNEELEQIKNKYDKLFNEMNQTQDELKQEKIEHERIKEKLQTTTKKMNQIQDELKQEKIEHERIKEKLQTTINKMKETKDELEQTKEELSKCKSKLIKFDDEKNHQTHNIVVGGYDGYYQVGEKPNNKNIDNNPIISPPIILSFNYIELLFYTVYEWHSVIYNKGGSLKGIGKNNEGRITSSLQKTVIDHFTEFSIKDSKGHQLDPISAVCYSFGTLYLFSEIVGNGRQLVLCDQIINKGDPVFLDIGNHQPVALFGGGYYSAAICSEGEIIFINRNLVKNSQESRIPTVSLPEGEKASSVACCDDSIIVLSSNNRVFSSPVIKGSSALNFSEVSELSGEEIVCVSGTNDHFLVVSKEGRVFGRGSNEHGKLGIGEGIESTTSFTVISLEGYKIRAAYAGGYHSLFETNEGKILSCGNNSFGQLLLSCGPGKDFYRPIETTITGGATFCIAGWSLSAVFIGREPPPNNPNIRIIYE